jgi:hypothetical protein
MRKTETIVAWRSIEGDVRDILTFEIGFIYEGSGCARLLQISQE